jgi:hypothetical protein
MACFCSSGEEAADRDRGSAISTRISGVGGSTEPEEGRGYGAAAAAQRRWIGEEEGLGKAEQVGDWRGLT